MSIQWGTKVSVQDIEKINVQLQKKTPKQIIQWVLSRSRQAIVTTNFRPYESAILHAVSSIKNDITVVWCDTGYNTPQTYKHAEKLISKFNLNIQLYVPQQTAAHRDVVLGLPTIDDPKHNIFTEQVKLEPFKRAMKIHQPNVWFTNLRKGQTAFRDSLNIASKSNDGVLKISPFYHWTDQELDAYLKENLLPNEFNYFDPTKVESNRECGLHI